MRDTVDRERGDRQRKTSRQREKETDRKTDKLKERQSDRYMYM